MTPKDEERPSFKVVDRRSSMEDEEEGCCGGHDHHHDAPSMKDASANEQGPSMKNRPAISFSLFVQSLAHQAMMGLGIVPWPDSGLVKVELDLAKETIDIVVMLREKTKNNLSADEQAMIDSLLYQLQVAFVEIAKGPQGHSPIIK